MELELRNRCDAARIKKRRIFEELQQAKSFYYEAEQELHKAKLAVEMFPRVLYWGPLHPVKDKKAYDAQQASLPRLPDNVIDMIMYFYVNMPNKYLDWRREEYKPHLDALKLRELYDKWHVASVAWNEFDIYLRGYQYLEGQATFQPPPIYTIYNRQPFVLAQPATLKISPRSLVLANLC